MKSQFYLYISYIEQQNIFFLKQILNENVRDFVENGKSGGVDDVKSNKRIVTSRDPDTQKKIVFFYLYRTNDQMVTNLFYYLLFHPLCRFENCLMCIHVDIRH